MRQKILIVDDEVSICDLLKINLDMEGYETFVSNDGVDALNKIESIRPDLLILDLMLPGMNGFEILKRIASENPIPVIMLTAKSDLVDKVLGLELGADDYLTKPFHTRELIARVKALLRRASTDNRNDQHKCLTNGCLYIYPDKRKVILSGNELELSAKEYDLLFFLACHIEQVFTRDMLLEKVWGYDFTGDTRTVDVHIQRLRKKLRNTNNEDELVQTVFGVGYKMIKR